MTSQSPLFLYGIAALLLLCIAVIFYLVFLIRKSGKGKYSLNTKVKELESQLEQLQLENIGYRLNPHLLKNILNSVQSHAYQTYHAIDKLSEVLDYILYDSDRKFVSPKQEVEFALNLIEINKIKLSPCSI